MPVFFLCDAPYPNVPGVWTTRSEQDFLPGGFRIDGVLTKSDGDVEWFHDAAPPCSQDVQAALERLAREYLRGERLHPGHDFVRDASEGEEPEFVWRDAGEWRVCEESISLNDWGRL